MPFASAGALAHPLFVSGNVVAGLSVRQDNHTSVPST